MKDQSDTPETVYENRGGEVWERHPDGRRELFAHDIIERLTKLERERNEWKNKWADIARSAPKDIASMERERDEARKQVGNLPDESCRLSSLCRQFKMERDEARAQIEANHKATLAIEQMLYEAREERDEARRQLELAEDIIVRMSDTRKPLRETSNKLP